MTRRTRVSLITLLVLSLLVALSSWRFALIGFETAFPGAPFEGFLVNDRLAFIAHVVAAPVALALGAVQFFPRFRARSLARHRWIGRVYVVAILLGGVSAIALTFSMWDRPVAASGFLLLGAIWIGATVQAVLAARRGAIATHQAWMIRSFALTASALTLRLYLAGFLAAGQDYVAVSGLLAWLCWVPNLIFAEWLIRRPRALRDRPIPGAT